MGRNTDPTLDARLNAQVTATGYLVMLQSPLAGGGTMDLYLCDLGDLVAPFGSFTRSDLRVRGAGSDSVQLTVQNLDGAFGAYLLGAESMADIIVTIWQVEREAPDVPVLLGVYAPQSSDIGIDSASIVLRPLNFRYRFAPMIRITPRDGFKFAVQPGTVLVWGSTRIVINGEKL